MPGPLHGYRIVDLTSNVSGPLATMILADQGADVIKVEAPDGGDATRAGGNRRAGFTASFLNNNRNKRSIVLDLKQARSVAGVDAAGRRRRRLCPELPPRCRRTPRSRRGRRSRGVAKHRLCLDQRLWRNGPLCRKAGLRPGDPGLFRAGDGAGRLGRGAPAAAAHDPARQTDRDHRLAGDHRGTSGARAHRRRPACPAVDAGSCGRVPVEPRTWAARPLSATSRRARRRQARTT